jgi:hypothetical protein
VIAVNTGVAGGVSCRWTRHVCVGRLSHPRRLWHSNSTLLRYFLLVPLHHCGLGRSLRDEGTGANDDGVATKGWSDGSPIRQKPQETAIR